MIAQDPSAPGSARVIGSLTVDTVQILVEVVDGGVDILDLVEIVHADDLAVVRVLTNHRGHARSVQRSAHSLLERWPASVSTRPGI